MRAKNEYMNRHQENIKSLPGWEVWAVTGIMLATIIIISLA
jgi:hypothetical protein